MTTVRVQKSKDNPYVQMDKRPLNDERLTWKAKGILAYLLSKPDDWQIWVTDLVKRSKDGGHAVRTGLQELMEHGYATRKQERDDAGKYKTLEWIIHEQPLGGFPQADKPGAEKPQGDKPDAENHTLTNNDSTKSDNTDNDSTEKEDIFNANSDFPPKEQFKGEYKPGPGKIVSCVDPDTGEEVGEPDWRFPQTQIQHQAFNITGRKRFSSKTEYNKMRKIEYKLENGELPHEFWEAQKGCARSFRWSFPILLKSTLNPDRFREWQRQEREAERERKKQHCER